VKIASERRLETTDIFLTPDAIRMDHQVPELENIYSKCKDKARTKLEKMRSSTAEAKDKSIKKVLKEKMTKSESLILAKAIFLHQKNNIILTGLLRLMNTLVQAFPAILVARLLRLIEAGDACHPSKAVKAALDLVSVLSLKMVVENAYFHNVVKCSTMVRGSLSGMIFDKSLKVSVNMDHHEDSHVPEKTDNEDGKIDKSAPSVKASSVLNLIQSDVSTIEMTMLQIHTVWDGLLQICIYSTLLYKYLGPSVFWGISVLLLTIPTNALFLRVLNRLSKFESEAKDTRTRKTSEAITNMKFLKLQAWDKHFEQDIHEARKQELKRHRDRGAFRALNQAISNAVPAIVLVVTLAAYRKTGRPLVASTIFTAISLFNQLRFPLLFYPMVIDALANGKNSLRRLSKYLCQEDLTPYVQYLPKINGEGGLYMKNGNFLWSKPQSADSRKGNGDSAGLPALCGASIEVGAGEVVAVVGSVGTGKSALIKALLGELEPVPRLVVDTSMGNSLEVRSESSVNEIVTVTMKGDVAYCPQEAWLSKGTLRDAILFGRAYNKEQYERAIYDAGLDDDICSGTLSHDTQVGEGGFSLSGGQRARVQLARALYDENVGVYLLDDPLSALDAAVSATVFDRILARMRERKAAVIFVTNDISLPRRCDKVVLMGKIENKMMPKSSCSRVVDVGTYDELISRGHDLRSITIHHSDSEQYSSNAEKSNQTDNSSENENVDSDLFDDIDIETGIEEAKRKECLTTMLGLSNSTDVVSALGYDNGKNVSASVNDSSQKDLETVDDKISQGAVPWSTYTTYFKSARSPLLISAALGCYLLSNGAQFLQQYTVARWTELGADAASALGTKYLQSLVSTAVIFSFLLWLRSFLLMTLGLKASDFIHRKMLGSVFNAPVTFFDKTPSGQLLSRFGKELDTVDRGVPDGIGSVLFCFLNIAITVAGLTGLMTPAMLVPLFFISILYAKIMSQFRPTARDLKRIESKSRSPIYTHFSEALKGAETIRSFPNSASLWSSNLRSFVDTNLNVIYSVKALDRWLSVRLESLGNIVVLTAAFASVFLTRMGRMKSGSAGWGLTQSLAITGLLTWAVRVLTDLETQMLSVQRVGELTALDTNSSSNVTSSMPQEYRDAGEALLSQDYYKGAKRLPPAPSHEKALVASGWPWKGRISFKNVSMKYAPTAPLALKNVSLDIAPGSTLVSIRRHSSMWM
jgi:ABC-type multidrug transport system fused ATPase/permease subunit